MSSTDWSADSTALFNLYGSLIRSKLDYECIAYGSVRQSDKYKVAWYNSSSRISALTWKVQNVSNWEFNVETNEPSLENRRIKLDMQPNWMLILLILYTKMFSINNPIQFHLLDSWVKSHFENSDINLDDIAPIVIPENPPWLNQNLPLI
jgi:hypothetical protein